MTTHYMDEAEECDRIAIIDGGQIVALGTPDEVKAMVGGDVVTLATSDNVTAAAEIQSLFGLEPTVDNGSLRVEVADGAEFIPRLVRETSVPVTSVSTHRPSLDDVFLKLTGHGIREEGAATGDHMRAFMRMRGGH
jgi:ABC-2 type transport system ATP-binding protein